MPAVGKIDLKASKDVSAGTETSLAELFVYPERDKEITLDSDVTRGTTKLKIAAAKLASIDFTADATKKKGEKTNLTGITKYSDLSKKIKASEAIKKGDTLIVTIETA